MSSSSRIKPLDQCGDRADALATGLNDGAAFTPGPWEVAWSTEDGAYHVESAARRGAVIAKRGPWGHNAAESVANARLIAAAPDLYEAVKAAAETFRTYERSHRAKAHEATFEDIRRERHAKADENGRLALMCEAALAKAQGRQDG